MDVPLDKCFEQGELKSEYNLDHEAEATAKAAEWAQDAILREVFNDLASVASETRLHHEWKSDKHFLDLIRLATSKTGKTVGFRSNWAIVPDRFFKALKTDEGYKEEAVGGVLDGKLRIYIDVGNMSLKQQENLIQRMKEKINERNERRTSFLP